MNVQSELFGDHALSDLLAEQRGIAHDEIEAMDPLEFFSDSEDSLVSKLEQQFKIVPVQLLESERQLVPPKEVSSGDFDPISKQSYPCTKLELRVEIPFAGNAELFSYRPSQHYVDAPCGEIGSDKKTLIVTVHTNDQDSERVRKVIDARIQSITDYLGFQESQLTKWNKKLSEDILRWVAARGRKLEADKKLVAGLGFKIRRHDQPPVTHDFPLVQKSIPNLPQRKSAPGSESYKAVSVGIYDDILKVLASMSLAVERSPTAFARIKEEHLRDWFLVALNGHFHGDATGETFNNEGKTDIMIRVDGAPIFIAECKFWGGEKALLETIDQLLGYLTWRDSKAAILVFSRNADFTAVLRQIPEVTKKHAHFVREVSRTETGFRFHLRNKTDPAREHLVTLLAFNIPRVAA